LQLFSEKQPCYQKLERPPDIGDFTPILSSPDKKPDAGREAVARMSRVDATSKK